MSQTLHIFQYLFAAIALLDLSAVFSRDLMMFQQNSYRKERYMRWFSQSGESTNLGRIFCCIGLFFLLVTRIPFIASLAVCLTITLWQYVVLRRKKYKKPLVWTPRARRIFGVMFAIIALQAAP